MDLVNFKDLKDCHNHHYTIDLGFFFARSVRSPCHSPTRSKAEGGVTKQKSWVLKRRHKPGVNNFNFLFWVICEIDLCRSFRTRCFFYLPHPAMPIFCEFWKDASTSLFVSLLSCSRIMSYLIFKVQQEKSLKLYPLLPFVLAN